LLQEKILDGIIIIIGKITDYNPLMNLEMEEEDPIPNYGYIYGLEED